MYVELKQKNKNSWLATLLNGYCSYCMAVMPSRSLAQKQNLQDFQTQPASYTFGKSALHSFSVGHKFESSAR